MAVAAPFLYHALKPDPLWLSRTLGFCPVDKVHISPSGTHGIRVFITDGGATGYGGIFVYEKHGRNYEPVFQANPAVAIPDSHSVKWITETKLELRYVNPHGGAQSDVLKELELK